MKVDGVHMGWLTWWRPMWTAQGSRLFGWLACMLKQKTVIVHPPALPLTHCHLPQDTLLITPQVFHFKWKSGLCKNFYPNPSNLRLRGFLIFDETHFGSHSASSLWQTGLRPQLYINLWTTHMKTSYTYFQGYLLMYWHNWCFSITELNSTKFSKTMLQLYLFKILLNNLSVSDTVEVSVSSTSCSASCADEVEVVHCHFPV